MKLHAGFSVHPRRFRSRMHVRIAGSLLPLMTSILWLFILPALVVTSLLGLDDVFFHPQDQTVREGQAVFFQCVSGESSPPANITWLKDEAVITRGKQFQGEYGGGQQNKTSGTLHLSNVTSEDDGVYVCVARNDLLKSIRSSKPAKLTVHGVPAELRIVRGPENITVAMGTNISMPCSVRGFPVPMVHWFKDGCLLLNCSGSLSVQNNGQLLTFSNVSEEDEGWYHCQASNRMETVSSRSAFLLPAEMDRRFARQPEDATVKRGANVSLPCRPPRSRPEALVSWFKDDRLLAASPHIATLPSGDLFFNSIKERDSGSYFCTASNVHLKRFVSSRRATLTVLAPPSVKLQPAALTVPLGAPAALHCQASGHPRPSISWLKRGSSKHTGGKVAYGQSNATLQILSARSYDEAAYVCEASNALGSSRGTALLRVAVSPIIVSHVSRMSCRIRSTVVLPCRAVGISPITYSWTRTRTPIGPSGNKHVDEAGFLRISTVEPSDAGEYVCTAVNRAGRHQRSTILTVTGSGVALTSQLNLNESAVTTTSSKLDVSQHRRTTSPGPLLTQMQPPILPPPPHPHFQSADLYTQPTTRKMSLLTSKPNLPVTLGSNPAQLRKQFHHQVSEEEFVESISEGFTFQSASKLPARGPFGLPTQSSAPQSHPTTTYLEHLLTSGPFPPSLSISPTYQTPLHQTSNFLPKFHLQTLTEAPSSPVSDRLPTQLHRDPSGTTGGAGNPGSAVADPTLVHLENRSSQVNTTHTGTPSSKAEPTNWLKRNTSQEPITSSDPRLTQESSSWLPALEKHDIPIVVGVGVSLAFIFITVTFYSVVQKNEPAPTSRSAQRNIAVPVRQAERRTGGRTNRAFEDDDCVAVIEQSPNTSDTRARPPGPGLVSVEMEPTSEEHREVLLDSRSVTVETHPEPVVDTKIDPNLQDEKSRSVSDPSIQLLCTEDWTGNLADNRSPYADAFPPPSPFPSPTPPRSSQRHEAVRSSLTFQSTEPRLAPIHHSLSISHHLSMGLTTVAVDVQFFPAVSASVAVDATTRMNSDSASTAVTAPLFSPSPFTSQENDGQSAARTPPGVFDLHRR